MARIINDLDPIEPEEEQYYQAALVELGGDDYPNWYYLIEPRLGYVYSNIGVISGVDMDGNNLLPDDFSKPTESEVNAKIAELKTVYAAGEYKRQRRDEYPRLAEQLDMIYNEGIDAWKASIKKIKDKYPKG